MARFNVPKISFIQLFFLNYLDLFAMSSFYSFVSGHRSNTKQVIAILVCSSLLKYPSESCCFFLLLLTIFIDIALVETADDFLLIVSKYAILVVLVVLKMPYLWAVVASRRQLHEPFRRTLLSHPNTPWPITVAQYFIISFLKSCQLIDLVIYKFVLVTLSTFLGSKSNFLVWILLSKFPEHWFILARSSDHIEF